MVWWFNGSFITEREDQGEQPVQAQARREKRRTCQGREGTHRAGEGGDAQARGGRGRIG